LEPAHIGYANGVLGGVVSALRCLASPGDPVLIHSPTYIGFTHALEDNGYHAVHSELKKDEEGIYRMDFAEMERLLKEKQTGGSGKTVYYTSGKAEDFSEAAALFLGCEKTDIRAEAIPPQPVPET
jgi:bifunctional pyridoxal-dependent enzyme with beta-cystathionase and maltose regulon repressor activities